jgi:glucose/arabinose dehydrogenase
VSASSPAYSLDEEANGEQAGDEVTMHRRASTRGAAWLLAGCLVVAVSACSDGQSGGGDGSSSSESEESASSSGPATRSDGDDPDAAAPSPEVAGTVATGLTSPWGLAFLPNGSALVSERDTALIKHVRPGGDVRTVGEVPDVDTTSTSEGGLLGIALHPDFPDRPYLYAYLTSSDDNRVVRMTYDGDRLGTADVVLDGIPRGTYHNGGRIAFGPDGLLYATTGDATEAGSSTDPDSLGGKVLRTTPTGEAAPDNPDRGSPVYSSGHRNGQGIAWDDDGRLWQAEFGQDQWDELNLIEAGGNYGWPECEGSCEQTGLVDPQQQWSTDEASPSGIAFADGAVWMAALRGERLWRIPTSDGQVTEEPTAFLSGEYGRLRTVAAAPDGSLWVITSNTDGRGDPASGDDRILRVTLD